MTAGEKQLPGILLICQSTGPYFSIIQALSKDYAVTVCSRFEGIQKRIKEQSFDLLIIEHVLNDDIVMHALQLCKPATQKGARVVLLDGHPRKEFIAAAFAHGLCDYFPAPVQQDLLIERVKGLLKRPEQT